MADWPEVDLNEVRRAFKGRYEVYDEIAYWVTEKGWRVRGQGHKFGLYPPNPGFRLIPPWVRVDGTVKANPTWQAKTVRRECLAMEARIREGPL